VKNCTFLQTFWDNISVPSCALGQAVQEGCWEHLGMQFIYRMVRAVIGLADGTDRSSQNAGKKLSFYAVQNPNNSADLINTVA